MFGHRVNNATIKLNIYKGSLLKTYTGVTDGNGEVTFRISQSEGTYLATFDFDGDVWYIDSTGVANIVVDSQLHLVRFLLMQVILFSIMVKIGIL